MIVHKKQNIRTALNFLTEDRMVGFCCIHVCLLFDCSMLLQYFPIKRQNPYMANIIISSISVYSISVMFTDVISP